MQFLKFFAFLFFRCLARLLENWDPLKHFFHEEQKKKKPGKSEERGYSAQKVDVIFQFVRSPTNRLYCLFLSYTIKAFEKVLLKLQAEDPMIHEVRPLLCNLLTDLYSRFIKPDAILNHTVEEVRFKDRQKQKDDEDLLIGGEARDFLGKAEQNHLRKSRIKDFYSSVRAYFEAICAYLLVKLPLQDPLLQHICVVDPRNQVTAKSINLHYFLKRLPCLLPPSVTADTIIEQFCRYQSMDISMCLKNRIDEFWIAVSAKEPDLQSLCDVMLSLLTVPHSSAACERIFSCVRKNVTDQRSSLANQTIEALLVLKSKAKNFTKELTDDQLDRIKSAYYIAIKNP